MSKRIWLSNLALIAVLVVGVAYVLFAVVRIDPTQKQNTVRVMLAETGGLLERADVTYLGVPIGRVEKIGLRKDGVTAQIWLDDEFKVPVDSDVVVAGLSAAGEQHLDIRPRSAGGPYLKNGSVIDQKDTKTPRPFAELLAHVGSISEQLDPKKLGIVVEELAAATEGSAPDLKRMLTGGRFLLTGLEDVLPETVSLLEDSNTTLTTVADLTDELERFGTAGKKLGAALRGADPDIRRLLNESPEALRLAGDIISETGPNLNALLGDLAPITKLVGERIPAFSSYLPGLDELGNTLPYAARDGALHVVADIASKPICVYDTKRRPPTVAGPVNPDLTQHCKEYGPILQQRGSYNAPRPNSTARAGAGERSSAGTAADRDAATPREAPADWYGRYLTMLLGPR